LKTFRVVFFGEKEKKEKEFDRYIHVYLSG